MGWMIWDLNPGSGNRFFSFSKMARMALELTQPPSQWVLGLFPIGKVAEA